MKKIILVLFVMVLGGALGIYSNVNQEKDDKNSFEEQDDRVYIQSIANYKGFDSLIEDADSIIVGKIDSINMYGQYDEFSVSVNEVKKGEIVETIKVRNYMMKYSYDYKGEHISGSTNTNYEVGEEYIFILQHVKNVYDDMYMIMSDAYIPIETIDNSKVLSRNIENIDNCEKYIDQYEFKNDCGKGSELSIDYIDTDDEKIIFENSKIIAKIKVDNMYRSTDALDVYGCIILECLKGNEFLSDNKQVIIPFFKDSVESGCEYIVCLDCEEMDSILFTLSSKNSLYESRHYEYIKEMID